MPLIDKETIRHLPRTIKQFLTNLSIYSNESGICWPSQRRLADDMGVSPVTVKRAVSECKRLGLIEVRRRYKKSNVYRLLCLKESFHHSMGSSSETRELPLLRKETLNASVPDSPGSQSLLSEFLAVFGKRTYTKNFGYYLKLTNTVSHDYLFQALAYVKSAMRDADSGGGNPVRNPGGLLTFLLRKWGALPERTGPTVAPCSDTPTTFLRVPEVDRKLCVSPDAGVELARNILNKLRVPISATG